jgi:hypothetical protein
MLLSTPTSTDEVARLAAVLHRYEAHPDYEYSIAGDIPVRPFDSAASVVDGWVRNFAFPGTDDDTEHWMRLREDA